MPVEGKVYIIPLISPLRLTVLPFIKPEAIFPAHRPITVKRYIESVPISVIRATIQSNIKTQICIKKLMHTSLKDKIAVLMFLSELLRIKKPPSILLFKNMRVVCFLLQNIFVFFCFFLFCLCLFCSFLGSGSLCSESFIC